MTTETMTERDVYEVLALAAYAGVEIEVEGIDLTASQVRIEAGVRPGDELTVWTEGVAGERQHDRIPEGWHQRHIRECPALSDLRMLSDPDRRAFPVARHHTYRTRPTDLVASGPGHLDYSYAGPLLHDTRETYRGIRSAWDQAVARVRDYLASIPGVTIAD